MGDIQDVHKVNEFDMQQFISESVNEMLRPVSKEVKKIPEKLLKATFLSSLVTGGVGLATGYYLKTKASKGLRRGGSRRLW